MMQRRGKGQEGLRKEVCAQEKEGQKNEAREVDQLQGETEKKRQRGEADGHSGHEVEQCQGRTEK